MKKENDETVVQQADDVTINLCNGLFYVLRACVRVPENIVS